MITYEYDFGTSVVRTTTTSPHPPRAIDAMEARLVTARSFEVLAASLQLANQLFRCGSAPVMGPKIKPAVDGSNADRWGATTTNHVSYALDWAAPSDGVNDATRVITGDRWASHDDRVMLGFKDGHVESRRSTAPTGGRATESGPQTPIDFSVILDAEATVPDDAYTREGDDGEPLTPAAGSATRSWLK